MRKILLRCRFRGNNPSAGRRAGSSQGASRFLFSAFVIEPKALAERSDANGREVQVLWKGDGRGGGGVPLLRQTGGKPGGAFPPPRRRGRGVSGRRIGIFPGAALAAGGNAGAPCGRAPGRGAGAAEKAALAALAEDCRSPVRGAFAGRGGVVLVAKALQPAPNPGAFLPGGADDGVSARAGRGEVSPAGFGGHRGRLIPVQPRRPAVSPV